MITGILIVYTHYYGFLFIVAQIIAETYLMKKRGSEFRRIPGEFMRDGWPFYIPILSSVFWWIFLISNGFLFSQSTGGGIPLSILSIPAVIPFIFGAYRVPDSIEYIPMILVSVCMFILLITGITGTSKRTEERRSELIMISFVLSVSLLISFLIINIYGYRYFLILVPMILSLMVVKGKTGAFRKALVVSVIVLSLVANGVLYIEKEKDDWRGAVNFIEDKGEKGDVVVPVPYWERYTIDYYTDDLVVVFSSKEEDLSMKLNETDSLWLILREDKDDTWTRELLEREFGLPVSGKEFTGLEVYRFER